MIRRTLFAITLSAAFGVALGGALAAQKGAGGASAGYTCDGLQCTCQGDDDCNDLFGSGKCGDVASCDNETGICKCLILKKAPKGKHLPGKAPLSNTLQ